MAEKLADLNNALKAQNEEDSYDDDDSVDFDDYDIDFDEYEEDLDVIEVYDEDGNLVATYDSSEYDELKKQKIHGYT